MAHPSVAESLDRVVAQQKLLDHPFYRAWAAGTLTLDDLGYYSTQYWRQVEAFPGYLEALAERLPEGGARRIVLDNLRDERDEDHPALWRDFAASLDVTADDLRGASPEPETAACVLAFAEAAEGAPQAFAMGMLYAYESQTPEVAATKIAGLRDHYGVAGDGLAYFALHAELDVDHARELGRALEEADDPAEAERGAAAGAAAVWGLLDGVARARRITA